MATIKKPTIDDAMRLVHDYASTVEVLKSGGHGSSRNADLRVVELARAYVALLQTVAGQTVQLKNARFSIERALERFAEWPGDEQ